MDPATPHPSEQTFAQGPAGSAPQMPEKANALGIAGFVVSLLGLFGFCCGGGLLCIVGVILSLIALRHRRKGFAIAGIIIGAIGALFGIAWLALVGTGAYQGVQEALAKERVVATVEQAAASKNAPLTEAEVRAIIDADPWFQGSPIKVTRIESGDDAADPSTLFQVAGADGRFDTVDDFNLTVWDDGTVDGFSADPSLEDIFRETIEEAQRSR